MTYERDPESNDYFTESYFQKHDKFLKFRMDDRYVSPKPVYDLVVDGLVEISDDVVKSREIKAMSYRLNKNG